MLISSTLLARSADLLGKILSAWTYLFWALIFLFFFFILSFDFFFFFFNHQRILKNQETSTAKLLGSLELVARTHCARGWRWSSLQLSTFSGVSPAPRLSPRPPIPQLLGQPRRPLLPAGTYYLWLGGRRAGSSTYDPEVCCFRASRLPRQPLFPAGTIRAQRLEKEGALQ